MLIRQDGAIIWKTQLSSAVFATPFATELCVSVIQYARTANTQGHKDPNKISPQLSAEMQAEVQEAEAAGAATVEGVAERTRQISQPPRKRRRSTRSQSRSKKIQDLSPGIVTIADGAAAAASDGVSTGNSVTVGASASTKQALTKGVVCVSDTAGAMSVLDIFDGQVLFEIVF